MYKMIEQLVKTANELDAMGPGWSENKGSLESSFDKAVEKENKNKATKKAPDIGMKEVEQINREKNAFEKDNIEKEAGAYKGYVPWPMENDKIFGQALDYANQDTENEDLMMKRYYRGLREIYNNPNFNNAIGEQILPNMIAQNQKGIDLFGTKKKRVAEYSDKLNQVKGSTQKLHDDVANKLKKLKPEDLGDYNAFRDTLALQNAITNGVKMYDKKSNMNSVIENTYKYAQFSNSMLDKISKEILDNFIEKNASFREDYYKNKRVPKMKKEAEDPLAQMNRVNDSHRNSFMGGSFNQQQQFASSDKNEDEVADEEKEGNALAQMNRVNNSHRNSFKMASEGYIVTDLNAILEKIASVRPISKEELKAVAYEFNKVAYESNKSAIEKIAAEDEKDKISKVDFEKVKKMADFKFDNANNMKSGTFISYPEINGSDITMRSAIVLESSNDDVSNTKCKFVLSNDGRIKFLSGEEFPCKESAVPFKFKTVEFRTLKQGDNFIVLDGDKVITPSHVRYIDSLSVGGFGVDKKVETIGYNFRLEPIYSKEKLRDMEASGNGLCGGSLLKNNKDYSVLTLSDTKLEKVPYDEFVTRKAKESVADESLVNSLMPYSVKDKDYVLSTSEDTKVILVKGSITNNIKSDKEFNEKRNLIEAGYDIQKVAFALNTVTVECMDRHMKLYNISVDYKDTDERLFALRNQKFNRISEGKLKAILRIIKFQGNKLNEIIYKAKNEPKAVYPIPSDCTIKDIKRLQGGNITNISSKAVKDTFNKYVNPLSIAKSVATATMGGLIAESAKNLIPKEGLGKAGMRAVNIIQKMSAESGELSAEFEKIAQQTENCEMLDIAKIMAIGHYYGEKLAQVIDDTDNSYPSLKDVTRDIALARPVMEKLSYDLMTLKVNQGINKVASVDSNNISRVIANMDMLYKIASAVDRDINPDKLNFVNK